MFTNLSYLSISSLSKVLVGILVMLGWETGIAEELANALSTSVENVWAIILVIWGGADTWGNKNRKGTGMKSLIYYRE